MNIRKITTVETSADNWPKCLTALTRKLREAKIGEADVISLQCEYDDSGVSARVFYWS